MSADDATAASTGTGTGTDTDVTPAAIDPDAQTKLRIRGVHKQFGRVIALDGVDLDVYDGEVFALIGDNGAGKSTLMNIVSGVFAPTEGEIRLDGEPVEFNTPSDARDVGIETVYQDLALMDDLDIATNIFIGQFPTRRIGPFTFVDWSTTYERAEEILHGQLGRTEMSIETEVQFLSGGQRQLVAVARSLAFDPEVIILDEPTSALSIDAAKLVHRTIDRLREEGITVVIVSHSIEDVLQFADRIGVLYQGQLVDITTPEETDLQELSNIMTTGSR